MKNGFVNNKIIGVVHILLTNYLVVSINGGNGKYIMTFP